jgi:hypothetical protein
VRETQVVDNWVSTCLSFFLSASTAATYIFVAPTYTATIITLEPCALTAEFQTRVQGPKAQEPIWSKHSLELDPSSRYKKTFFLKVHWVCWKAWGPTWGSNIKNVWLILERIRLTFNGFFFFFFFGQIQVPYFLLGQWGVALHHPPIFFQLFHLFYFCLLS